MVDFLKIQTTYEATISCIDKHHLLIFKDQLSIDTGELGKYRFATYKNMNFQLFYPTNYHPNGRLIITGSIHKFWNDGKHNYNDFHLSHFQVTTQRLITLFGLIANECFIVNLEIGVNIIPQDTSNKILNNIKGEYYGVRITKYNSKKTGHGIQIEKARHIIKIYDKALQATSLGYNVPHEILRIEKKYLRSEAIYKDLGIKTLNDLMATDFNEYASQLSDMWWKILIYDWPVFDGSKHQNNYSSSTFWEGLKRSNFKKNKQYMDTVLRNNIKSLKSTINEQIIHKVKLLKGIPLERLLTPSKKTLPVTQTNCNSSRNNLISANNH